MKTQKGFRKENSTNELRKSKRLEPMVKSGKERYHLYRDIDNGDSDEELTLIPKRESVLDYFDDGDDE